MGPREQAPEPLALLQRFVNTREYLDLDREDLDSPQALHAWLSAQPLPAPTSISTGDLDEVRAIREAMRAVLVTHSGRPGDPDAAALLDSVSRRSGVHPGFDPDTGQVVIQVAARPGSLDAALGRLLAVAATAAADGTWHRLKACANLDCGWAFYDRSRNHAGRWCEMNTCGARHKMRTYRARTGTAP